MTQPAYRRWVPWLLLASLIVASAILAATSTPAGRSHHRASLPAFTRSSAFAFSSRFFSIYSVSCTGAGRCLAVGGRHGSYYRSQLLETVNGRSWSLVPSGSYLGPTACTPHGWCAAAGVPCNQACGSGGGPVGDVDVFFTARPSTRTLNEKPIGAADVLGASPPMSMGCGAPGHCVVVGSDALASTTDDGGHWHVWPVPWSLPIHSVPPSPLEPPLSTTSCATTLRCAVAAPPYAAPSLLVTTNGGASWVARPVPGVGAADLECIGRSVCWAYARATSRASELTLYRSTDGAASWHPRHLPGGADIVTVGGMWCSKPSTCWTLVSTVRGAVMETTTNGGRSWVRTAIMSSRHFRDVVTCPTATTCVTVDDIATPGSPVYGQPSQGIAILHAPTRH